jgi:putative ABC transport system substrate-binding protein
VLPGDFMKRRDFIVALGGVAVTAPFAARAQQPGRLAQIGYLSIAPAAQSDDAFREGMREYGYIEGKNLHIEYRAAEGDQSRLPALLNQLIDLKVDVIVTYANGVVAAWQATKTIPIVMAVGPDLVALGVADNLAHPGGNVTGSSFFVPEIMAKRIERLKELVPSVTKIGVLLVRRGDNGNSRILEVMQPTAQALSVELHPIEISTPGDFDNAFSAWRDARTNGIIMNDHGLLLANASAIATLAAQHQLPSIGPVELVVNGGLMGYGVNFPEIFRRAPYFIDKILKGTRPGDIPIEQATKFKAILNLRAAKALGIAVPPNLLSVADEVIE